MEAIHPDRWERALIDRQRVARLATVDARGRPQIVPIVFAFDGLRLFTPLDAKPKRVAPRELQRVRNIQREPHVAVLFDEYAEDWRQLAWVQLRGWAALIEAGTEREAGAALLEARYPQYQRLSLAGSPLILVRIDQMVSWRASDL